MFMAEKYFELDSFNLALNGNTEHLGFLDIIDDYKRTKSANLANYYAGLCYYYLGDYELAIDYVSDFSTSNPIEVKASEVLMMSNGIDKYLLSQL